MSKLPIGSVFSIIMNGKSSLRFLFATILSFAFSMSVILCTIGLMDGFELTLKQALSHANGDIKLTSVNGFFLSDKKFQDKIQEQKSVKYYTPVLQIESFALTEQGSKGVLIKGINPEEFQLITKLKFENLKDGIFVGAQFAKTHQVEVGDTLVLALASSKTKNQGSAALKDLEVRGIISHGIYEKDMRFIYMNKLVLEKMLDYKSHVSNMGLIKIESFSNIEKSISSLRKVFIEEFHFEPFWKEFDVLLNAVQVEKKSISLVLQLIVLVAILNIIAFILYISEIKSQDIFLLRALGLGAGHVRKFWFFMLFSIWFISIFLCFFLKELFAYLIQVIPFLKLPGDVYVLSELKVDLDLMDYVYVYGISLIWVMVIGYFTMKKITKKSVIGGLRQEFS